MLPTLPTLVKKLFALASVSAVGGLMMTMAAAGCSSTKTDGGGTVVDAARAVVGDDEEPQTPAGKACPSKDPIDATKLPWKAPSILTGSCTEKELEELVTFVATNSSAKYADWKKTVTNPACNSCMFGKESDATWKPLLEDANGTLVALNVGGCIAIASGAESCGRSYQNWFDCRFEACAGCPNADSAGVQKCLSNASKAACKKAFEDARTICGDGVIGDAETKCQGTKYVFEGPVRAQCIGFREGGE